MNPARKRVVRLVVALSAAVVLAGALIYTSFSAASPALSCGAAGQPVESFLRRCGRGEPVATSEVRPRRTLVVISVRHYAVRYRTSAHEPQG